MVPRSRDGLFFFICFISKCIVRLLIVLTKKTLNKKAWLFCMFNILGKKTLNKMSLVVLHVQYFENKIVEDIGVSKDGQPVGYSFLLSKKIKLTTQSFWCTYIFIKIAGAWVTKNKLNLKKF